MTYNYCPLIRRDDGEICACFTDDCAWFDHERGVCAMVAIAREIRDREADMKENEATEQPIDQERCNAMILAYRDVLTRLRSGRWFP